MRGHFSTSGGTAHAENPENPLVTSALGSKGLSAGPLALGPTEEKEGAGGVAAAAGLRMRPAGSKHAPPPPRGARVGGRGLCSQQSPVRTTEASPRDAGCCGTCRLASPGPLPRHGPSGAAGADVGAGWGAAHLPSGRRTKTQPSSAAGPGSSGTAAVRTAGESRGQPGQPPAPRADADSTRGAETKIKPRGHSFVGPRSSAAHGAPALVGADGEHNAPFLLGCSSRRALIPGSTPTFPGEPGELARGFHSCRVPP